MFSGYQNKVHLGLLEGEVPGAELRDQLVRVSHVGNLDTSRVPVRNQQAAVLHVSILIIVVWGQLVCDTNKRLQ